MGSLTLGQAPFFTSRRNDHAKIYISPAFDDDPGYAGRDG